MHGYVHVGGNVYKDYQCETCDKTYYVFFAHTNPPRATAADADTTADDDADLRACLVSAEPIDAPFADGYMVPRERAGTTAAHNTR